MGWADFARDKTWITQLNCLSFHNTSAQEIDFALNPGVGRVDDVVSTLGPCSYLLLKDRKEEMIVI